MSETLTKAAAGAAAGLALGPLGALGGALVAILPDAARWVFGSGASAEVAQAAATGAVRSIVGDVTPEAVQAAAMADPTVAVQLRVELARITASHDQVVRLAELADVQDARKQTLTLAAASSPIAYGAVVMSVFVLAMNLIMVTLLLTRSFPAESKDIVLLLVGQVAGWGTVAVGYWLGSSAGSAAKSARLADRTDRAEKAAGVG
jgi:hypothetical protein